MCVCVRGYDYKDIAVCMGYVDQPIMMVTSSVSKVPFVEIYAR